MTTAGGGSTWGSALTPRPRGWEGGAEPASWVSLRRGECGLPWRRASWMAWKGTVGFGRQQGVFSRSLCKWGARILVLTCEESFMSTRAFGLKTCNPRFWESSARPTCAAHRQLLGLALWRPQAWCPSPAAPPSCPLPCVGGSRVPRMSLCSADITLCLNELWSGGGNS